MELRIHEAVGSLEHLNARKVKREGQDEIYLDLKITAHVGVDVLSDFDVMLESYVFKPWMPDVPSVPCALRFPDMGPVEWNEIAEDMIVKLNKIELAGATLSKFKLAPYISPTLAGDARLVAVTFTATIRNPDRAQLYGIAALLKESMVVSVYPEQMGLFEQAKARVAAFKESLAEAGATVEVRTVDITTGEILAGQG